MSARANINMVDPTSELDIRQIGGRIGAEVRDLGLGPDLPDRTIQAIRQAMVRHKVIFFRDQHQLDDKSHEDFALRLGELFPHPTMTKRDGSNALVEIDAHKGRPANLWHTDITFVDAIPSASILRAVVLPSFGGDTMWANTAAAYQDLPDAMRTMVDTLWQIHTNVHEYGDAGAGETERERAYMRTSFAADVYETTHPLVHIHPESGERALLLGDAINPILGLTYPEARRIFEILESHVCLLENTVRWSWRLGDVAIWDNRATQHRLVADFGNEPRILRRVTLAGEVPVSIEGRKSHMNRPQSLAA
jgi:alpha-ketoglutarate-dependent taurine dioxygenase